MRSVTLKSAMTPSFMGLMATILPGVRPSISFASLPTASTSPVFLLMATMEGSLTTIPLPLAKTSVLAVPRSIARSEENRLNKERKYVADGAGPGALPQAEIKSARLPTATTTAARAFNRPSCIGEDLHAAAVTRYPRVSEAKDLHNRHFHVYIWQNGTSTSPGLPAGARRYHQGDTGTGVRS